MTDSRVIDLEEDPTFLREIWVSCSACSNPFVLLTHVASQAWFGIGVTVIFMRFAVRLRTVGLRGFQGDDYVTLVVSTRLPDNCPVTLT